MLLWFAVSRCYRECWETADRQYKARANTLIWTKLYHHKNNVIPASHSQFNTPGNSEVSFFLVFEKQGRGGVHLLGGGGDILGGRGKVGGSSWLKITEMK